MGLVIIFGMVALLACFGVVRSVKTKNLATAGVFDWFAVMTFLYNGYPAG
ncbi:DUF2759 family protein [Bacillus sp. AFS040349]|nr:DUF2759 family protein [Bacillus sp. AFS040349]PGT88238.1 DUF2759 domain-containing protein [Bacillus sp. AFS040349]